MKINLSGTTDMAVAWKQSVTNIHGLLANNQKDIGILITGASPIQRETAQVFTGIIGNTNMSASLIEAYSVDAWRFSGFKTNRMLDELKAIAYENKKLIPVKDLIAKSDKLYKTYNVNYLRAEVQQANNAALASERWHSFSDDSKYLLQYKTTNDERVRDDHAILNDITLPKSDPFWSEFYPPNGWGCRCLAVEVLSSQYKKTESVDTKYYKDKIFKSKNEKPFAFNPGIENRLFPPTASYYNVGNYKIIDDISKQLLLENTAKSILIKEYNNGSNTFVNQRVDKTANDYKDLTVISDLFAKEKSNTRVEILPKTHHKSLYYDYFFKGAYPLKNPDLKINDLFYEYKSYTSDWNKNKISHMLKKGLLQSDNIIIDLRNGFATDDHIKRSIHYRIKDGIRINEVWIYDKDGIRLLYKKAKPKQ
ncbi:MAG: phage minor head protein [Bacteroidota bacterium]|nr:phage minor head protein [Bacteroidota bacterium]